MVVVDHVHVEAVDVAEDDGVAAAEGLAGGGGVVVPDVDAANGGSNLGVELRAVADGYLLPSVHGDLALGEQLCHLTDEVGVDLFLGLQSVLLLEDADRVGAVPGAGSDLVAADVDAGEGHAGLAVHGDELVKDLAHELVRAGEGGVHGAVVVRLGGGVARGVAIVDEAVRGVALGGAYLHGLDGGAGVAGRLNLGENLNA